MPTYEYRCSSCTRTFEVVQRFSDPPLETCEECGGGLRRVFHPVGIVLKGSGFYATDNRSGKSLSPAKDGSAKETDSKDGGSKETASKDGGSKDGGSKDGGSKDGGSSSSGTSETKKGSSPTTKPAT